MSHVSSICKHHKVAFSTRFSLYHQSVKCSNIFGKHKISVPTGNNIVSLANCEDLASKKPNLHIFPGQRFCVTCYSQLYNSKVIDNPPKKSSSSSAMGDIESALQEIGSDDAFSSPMNSPTKEQKSILVTNLLDVTPVHVNIKKSTVRREPDIINKANQVRCAFINLHSNFIPSERSVTTSTKVADDSLFVADDLKKQMDEIRLKCLQLKSDGNASGIISLLTLAPSSWSQQTCADYFSVSISQVKRSRILKREKGILSVPDKKNGRKISLEEIEIVHDFYLSDDYSRMMPGMKDYVSVRQTGGEKKVKIQKRLLLINIDELFLNIKNSV